MFYSAAIQEIKNYLLRGIPALVTSFNVYEDLISNDDKNILTGIPTGELKGSHSMVLIGIRTETNADGITLDYFLFQNWWANQYFIELDATYFYHCQAVLIFVEKAMTNYSYDSRKLESIDIYLSNFSPYGETSVDKGETLTLEFQDQQHVPFAN
jgi:hypothetical protein